MINVRKFNPKVLKSNHNLGRLELLFLRQYAWLN